MEEKKEKTTVLCGANSYTEKYYFNEEFDLIPQSVKDELKILCVLFVEDVGGTITLEFNKAGELLITVWNDEADYLFDEIGAGLKVNQIFHEKAELIEQLETFYRVFIAKKL